MAEVYALHGAPVTYTEAIEAYLTAAGISVSSRRIDRISLTTWACLARGERAPIGRSRRGAKVPALVRQRGVVELVQGPAAAAGEFTGVGDALVRQRPGGFFEQFGSPPVGQPGPAGDGAHVQGRGAGWAFRLVRKTGPRVRPAIRRGSSCGLPVDPFDRAALGDDAGAFVGHEEIGDVEGEDLLGAGSRFIQLGWGRPSLVSGRSRAASANDSEDGTNTPTLLARSRHVASRDPWPAAAPDEPTDGNGQPLAVQDLRGPSSG